MRTDATTGGVRGGWSTGARAGEAELMDLHTRKASSDFLSGDVAQDCSTVVVCSSTMNE